MYNKRGQITMMVILGLVAIIIFSMVAFITKFTEEQRIENRVTKLAEEKVQAGKQVQVLHFLSSPNLPHFYIAIPYPQRAFPPALHKSVA